MPNRGRFAAELLRSCSRALAAGVAERQEQLQPDLMRTYGAAGSQDLAGDTEPRLLQLAAALEVARPALFHDAVSLLKVAHVARDLPVEILDVNLQCIAEEIAAQFHDAAAEVAVECLTDARRHLAQAPSSLPSLLAEDAPHVDLARRYLLAALEARADDAVTLLTAAFDRGVPVTELHSHVITKVQHEIGRMWLMNEIHVGEEHVTSQLTSRAMAALDERAPRSRRLAGRALCTSVPGDLHDLGLRSAANHLRWAGIDTVVLGASTPLPDLVLAAVDFSPDLLVVSASATVHVCSAKRTIETLRARLETPPPVLVGGRPFEVVPDLWEVIGADATAATGDEAERRAAELIAKSAARRAAG